MRIRRLLLVALVALLGATGAPGLAPAQVVTPVPAAEGWSIPDAWTSPSNVVVHGIHRASPLARGRVVVLPREQLGRLRTVLSSERLTGDGGGRETTSALCRRLHCHAAVNGDRWDTTGVEAGRPTGAVATDSELVATQGLAYGHLLIGENGSMQGTIDPLPLSPQVTVGERAVDLRVNRQPGDGRISAFTARYGPSTNTASDAVEHVFDIVGGDRHQQALRPRTRRFGGNGTVEAGTVVLAARDGEALAALGELWDEALAGGQATYRQGLNGFREILGGSPLLMLRGNYAFPAHVGDGRHPRTIVGWNQDRVWLVTVDGRQRGWSDGLTLDEAARLMAWLGATDALNLDGGGSTTLVEGGGRVTNRPSDDTQRAVATALVVLPPERRIGVPPPPRGLEQACPPGEVPPGRFSDVDPANPHAGAVDCLAWWDVTTGRTATGYGPHEAVRRDQMATFLARVLFMAGVPVNLDAPDAFVDDEGSVHERSINALAALGVVQGRPDGTYGPAAPVARGQMAAFLARTWEHAVGGQLPNNADFFFDDGGHAHERSINQMTEVGVAGGKADGAFGPADRLSRAQMASFLARLLSASVEAGRAAPPR